MALSAGFLLVGPFLALGLYQTLTHTPVMLCWGALITTMVLLAMLPGFAGLLLAGPVLGHASWHAYRATVQRLPSSANSCDAGKR